MGELVEHLVVLREPPLLVLREDQLAIDEDVELAAAAGLDVDLMPALLPDDGCETRSPRLVVSHLAVFDVDAHAHSMAPAAAPRKRAAW